MAEGLESPEQILAQLVEQVPWGNLRSLPGITRGWFHTSPISHETTTTHSHAAIDQAPSDWQLVSLHNPHPTEGPTNDSSDVDMAERETKPSTLETLEPDIGGAENLAGFVMQVENQPTRYISPDEEPERPNIQTVNSCAGNPEGDHSLSDEQTSSVVRVVVHPPLPFNGPHNEDSESLDVEMADGSAAVPPSTDTITSADSVRRSGRDRRVATMAEDPPTDDETDGNPRKRKRRALPTSTEEVREVDREDEQDISTQGNYYENPIDVDALVGMFPMKREHFVSEGFAVTNMLHDNVYAVC